MTAPLAMVDVGLLLLRLLAVAGGGAVGAFGSGLLLRWLGRMAGGRQVPQPIMTFVRILGGITMALVVWMWAFGVGGSGFGTGEGWGLGSGQGTGPKSDATAPISTAYSSPDVKKNGAGANQTSESLHVEMLGGQRVQDERFYLVEGASQPVSLAELRRQIQGHEPPYRRLEIVIYEQSVAQDHPAVRELERWAKQHDLTVSLSFPKK